MSISAIAPATKPPEISSDVISVSGLDKIESNPLPSTFLFVFCYSLIILSALFIVVKSFFCSNSRAKLR